MQREFEDNISKNFLSLLHPVSCSAISRKAKNKQNKLFGSANYETGGMVKR